MGARVESENNNSGLVCDGYGKKSFLVSISAITPEGSIKRDKKGGSFLRVVLKNGNTDGFSTVNCDGSTDNIPPGHKLNLSIESRKITITANDQPEILFNGNIPRPIDEATSQLRDPLIRKKA